MGEQKEPWERGPLEVTILDGYSAQIEGEDGDEFFISFYDRDGTPVEARLAKSEFRRWPCPPMECSYFGIMMYVDVSDNGKVKCSAWPIKHYWNPELRMHAEEDVPVRIGNIEKTSDQSVLMLEGGGIIVYEHITPNDHPEGYAWKEHAEDGSQTGVFGVVLIKDEPAAKRAVDEGLAPLILEEYKRKKVLRQKGQKPFP